MSSCKQCIARQLNAMNTLTKEEMKQVAACKTTRFYKKGDVIFNENEMLNGVYCVREGLCKLTKLSANGKDHTIKLMGKGDLIGQRSIISNERTNLSAIALNDMELCYVPKEQIISTIKTNQEFSFDILQNLAQDLREAEDDLINMAQKTVRERLAATIIYVSKNFGVDKEGYLKVHLSREDYASIVGTATESAIRILSQFKKEGLISTSGKRIKIENLKDLARVE
ncbi:Crp/Fnr family transcriptional regulator [Gelidibacter salicanalis]|uniref:Crp/Fnr family transcriptional regulator n=1 Tax=Gelidibacter salicanalis TaxID=291193 RepID=A0A934KV05_9FLAO|nr:Crp/Fnr family transcriptional regulator [Gelidibacter salicanalis]MBJ7881157.1 Crp/Fnr family transcriptional regulator [Gelidibacter salicanalis]